MGDILEFPKTIQPIEASHPVIEELNQLAEAGDPSASTDAIVFAKVFARMRAASEADNP